MLHRSRIALLAVLWSLAVASAAEAANDTTDAVDEMNAVSGKLFLRTGARRLAGIDPAEVVPFLSLARFEVAGPGDAEAQAQAWCLRSARQTQLARGNTDPRTGEARLTDEVIREVCAGTYEHDLEASVTCAVENRQTFTDAIAKRPAHPYAVCRSRGALRFQRFRPIPADGQVRFALDPSFGHGGFASVTASDETLSDIGKGSDAQRNALAAARRTSLAALGRSLGTETRRIRDFQSRAPITARRADRLSSCLPRTVARLDMPMYVQLAGPDGHPHTVGFAKMRRLTNGCTASPDSEGHDLGPSEAQLILGGGRVKPGMTLWEMPSSGWNVGVGVDASTGRNLSLDGIPLDGSLELRSIHADSEYSLSQLGFPISELYLRTGGALGAGSFSASPQTTLALLSGHAGLLKRFYVSGPLFWDLALDGNLSRIELAWVSTSALPSRLHSLSLALSAEAGLGVQISPRLILRSALHLSSQAHQLRPVDATPSADTETVLLQSPGRVGVGFFLLVTL